MFKWSVPLSILTQSCRSCVSVICFPVVVCVSVEPVRLNSRAGDSLLFDPAYCLLEATFSQKHSSGDSWFSELCVYRDGPVWGRGNSCTSPRVLWYHKNALSLITRCVSVPLTVLPTHTPTRSRAQRRVKLLMCLEFGLLHS